MQLLKKLLVLLFFLSMSICSSAQNFYKDRTSRDNIFSIGMGPSFAYIDNGGPYRNLNFKIRPSVTLSLIKRITPRFDLRASAGIQGIASTSNAAPFIQGYWFEQASAYTAVGHAYYFDVMPSANLVSFENHMNRSKVNLYGGLGLGVIHAQTEQTFTYSEDAQVSNKQITTGYVPVRAGLSFTLGPYSDIAGEGTMLFTFTDNLDGNIGSNKYGDHLAQAQIVYRRYFFPRNRE